MTIVIPPSPDRGGRPKGSTGNGKTLKEIELREQRNLARIKLDTSTAEARAAAEQLTKITELRTAQRAAKLDSYVQQESARAPQFQIDTKFTLGLLGALAIVMFITTAILTADGTIGSALAARFANPAFSFVLFGAFEVGILVFLLVYYIQGSRVDFDGTRPVALPWFIAMIVVSAVTVGLSVYHVLDLYDYDWQSIDMWVGIGIRLAVAVLFVVVSKAIATVLFAKAIHL